MFHPLRKACWHGALRARDGVDSASTALSAQRIRYVGRMKIRNSCNYRPRRATTPTNTEFSSWTVASSLPSKQQRSPPKSCPSTGFV